LHIKKNPNLIIGLEQPDDAGVYILSEDFALIQTLDFFTPIVNDPFDFGRIAAANSLSDVYAMGGKPLTAMNIVAFPSKKMDKNILKAIINGALEKIHEADAVLAGGHSIEDDEIKFGLSVTGIVSPDKVVTVSGAKAGDLLILTKPLGTGIIATALKGEMASEKAVKKMIETMAALNRYASEAMMKVGINACTDITGFGLIGHSYNIISASKVGMKLYLKELPVFSEAVEYSSYGLVPEGTKENARFYEHYVQLEGNIKPEVQDIIYDAQTSGGLLISVTVEKVNQLLLLLEESGIQHAGVVGEIIENPVGKIIVETGDSSVRNI